MEMPTYGPRELAFSPWSLPVLYSIATTVRVAIMLLSRLTQSGEAKRQPNYYPREPKASQTAPRDTVPDNFLPQGIGIYRVHPMFYYIAARVGAALLARIPSSVWRKASSFYSF